MASSSSAPIEKEVVSISELELQARHNFSTDEIVACESPLSRAGADGGGLISSADFSFMNEWEQAQGQQLQRENSEEEEEDPFLDDDFLNEYNTTRVKFSRFTVIHLMNFFLLVITLCCSLVIPPLKRLSIAGLEFWEWVLMAFLLICGRMISGWVIRVVLLLMERDFILRKRALYYVYSLRSSVQNCVWLSLVLIVWLCLFSTRLQKDTVGVLLPPLTELLTCLFVGTWVWLAKTVFVMIFVMSYHVRTYFRRIQNCLFHHYVIQILCRAPLLSGNLRKQKEQYTSRPRQNSHASSFLRMIMPKKDKVEEKTISLDYMRRLTGKNISPWNMKRLMKIVRKGVLSTFDEHLNESRSRNHSALQEMSERLGNTAAKKIFDNVAKSGSEYIYKDDLICFMREDEASKVLRLIQGVHDETKGISKRTLTNWAVKAFLDRRVLALSLKDKKAVVNNVHYMLNVAVVAVVSVIWPLVFHVKTLGYYVQILFQISAILLVFSDAAKRIIENIQFIFIQCSDDVGDDVTIDEFKLVVEEVHLTTTVLARKDIKDKMTYSNSYPRKQIGCNASKGAEESNPFLE